MRFWTTILKFGEVDAQGRMYLRQDFESPKTVPVEDVNENDDNGLQTRERVGHADIHTDDLEVTADVLLYEGNEPRPVVASGTGRVVDGIVKDYIMEQLVTVSHRYFDEE